MKKKFQFTAVIEKEGDGYVSLCPAGVGDEGGHAEVKIMLLYYSMVISQSIPVIFPSIVF